MCDDQVSLIDIICRLAKHKKLFWRVFFIAVVIGVGVIFALPTKYQYTQAIKLPGYFDLDRAGYVYLSDKNTVANQIKNIYLPTALNHYRSRHSDEREISQDKITVMLNNSNQAYDKKVEENGQIFLMASDRAIKKESYQEVYQTIFSLLASDMKPLYEGMKQNLIDYQEGAHQYVELKKRVIKQNGNESAMSAMPTTKGGSLARDLLLLSSVDMLRNMKINKVALDTLQETRLDSEFVMSKVHFISKAALIVLLGFASLMLSFLIVMWVEFMEKVKQMTRVKA